MKRSPMPSRRKPLRRTQFRQTLRNGKRSAPWHRARQWCFDRAAGRCEAHAAPDCTGRAEHAHHMLLRSQGGPDTEDNLLAVCHRCHDWIHKHPQASYANGWLRHREAS